MPRYKKLLYLILKTSLNNYSEDKNFKEVASLSNCYIKNLSGVMESLETVEHCLIETLERENSFLNKLESMRANILIRMTFLNL